jgi:hypothetical protein
VNNKYVKYFLIIAVVAVWATIAYRIVSGVGAATVPASVQRAPVPAGPVSVVDSFQLYADYPDPFLGDNDSTSADSVAAKTALSAPGAAGAPGAATVPASAVTAESMAGWLQFKGVVSNPRNRRRVAIISIRGKDFLVRVNDLVEGVRIQRIEKSGLLVAYQGTTVELAPRSVPLALGN